MLKLTVFVICAGAMLWCGAPVSAAPRLKISENKRFLVNENGKPFFYLGDTAWNCFIALIAKKRTNTSKIAPKGIYGYSGGRVGGIERLERSKSLRSKPLIDNDPTKPDVKDGPQNDYWGHVDYIVNKAEKLGLTIGFFQPGATNGIRNGRRTPR